MKNSAVNIELCLICDRGQISKTFLKDLDNHGMDSIFMLDPYLREYDCLVEQAIDKNCSYQNEIRNIQDDERYGLISECKLYKEDPSSKVQILWSAERYQNRFNKVKRQIESVRSWMQNFIEGNRQNPLFSRRLKIFIPASG